MRLSGPQTIEFRDALLEAFSPEDFDEMLRHQLDRRRTDIALGPDQRTIVLRVIERFNQEYRVEELLRAARFSRPGDPGLQAVSVEVGRGISLPAEVITPQSLQRTIDQSKSMLDVARWRARLAQIEHQVCRIELDTTPDPHFGTGFLIAPDMVMTSYHVLEDVVAGHLRPERVVFRFDYAIMSDGRTPVPGTVYALAGADWLVDYSAYSPCDLSPCAGGRLPSPAELDYAVVRLACAAGKDPVAGSLNKDPGASRRGWIELPGNPHRFEPGSALFIVQHPNGEPLKLALDTDAIIGFNGNRTRVHYTTNTEGGSSGSPCFDANWQCVALHQSGDPNYTAFSQPGYNQGIPMAAILGRLAERGHLSMLEDS